VTTQEGPPSVNYRGIFINDEAPALAEWVHKNYGPDFNSEFYKRVFELLLPRIINDCTFLLVGKNQGIVI
jgi:Glycosyl hydrolase family 115